MKAKEYQRLLRHARQDYGEVGAVAFQLTEDERIKTQDGDPVWIPTWVAEPLWILDALTADECDRLATAKRGAPRAVGALPPDRLDEETL